MARHNSSWNIYDLLDSSVIVGYQNIQPLSLYTRHDTDVMERTLVKTERKQVSNG